MDFQNFGKHCAESTCRQKDFLPFTCKYCNKVYCLDHRDVTSHECPNGNMGDKKAIICPICLKSLNFDSGVTTEDEKWNLHYTTDCKPDNYTKIKAEKSKTCNVKGCREKLTVLNTHTCKTCRQELCLKHRFTDNHECGYQPKKYVIDDRHLMNNKQTAPSQNTQKNNTIVGMFNAQQQRNAMNQQQQQQQQEICGICSMKFANLEELISHAEKTHY